jgi:hypothetical protein
MRNEKWKISLLLKPEFKPRLSPSRYFLLPSALCRLRPALGLPDLSSYKNYSFDLSPLCFYDDPL